MDDFEMTIIVDIEEIEKLLWMKLVQRHYVPSDAETQDLADIFLEMLYDLGFIDEIVDIEEED